MSSDDGSGTLASLPFLVPTVQAAFAVRLISARQEFLLPALLKHVATLDITAIDNELHSYAGSGKLKPLAVAGLRGELLYPVPMILSGKPSLLAYYRLLLGISQKEFSKSPLATFMSMETRDVITPKLEGMLPDLCRQLTASAWILLSGLPEVSQDFLNALGLLTYGAQLRGSYNTKLGQDATKLVFKHIRSLVQASIQEEDDTALVVRNAAGREVRIEFAPDPDIAIREKLGSGRLNNRIAIEIKGGRDRANIHNRLGEAEKSHQNARNQHFTQFWTMVNVSHFDIESAAKESPTTTAFYVIDEILNPKSPKHSEFKELILSELGIGA